MEQIETKDKVTHSLGTEKIGKLIARFAIPSVISLLVNSLYNIVDQIFIGQKVGYLGNAATNVAFPIVTLSMAIALLLGDGCAAHLSLKLGEGKKESAARGVGNMLIVALAGGVLFMAAGLIFLSPLMRAFGATDKVMPYATEYTRIILMGVPFVIVGTSLNSVIRADGSPRFAMISMIAGAVTNVILDYTFMFPMDMGVDGAAIATILGQILSCVISLFYLKRFKSIDLKKRYFKLQGSMISTVCKLGVSSFITQMAITVVQIALNNTLATYGALSIYGSEIPLSCVGIVMKVNQIMISVVVGIAIGAQPITGYNYGAKNYGRVKKTYLTSMLLALLCSTLFYLVFMIFPESVISIFGQEDALYNAFAVKTFRTFLALCFVAGFQITSSHFFQAVGKPMRAATLSLSRQVLFLVPLVLILPMFMGLDGVLYAGPIADGCAAVLSAVFISIEMRRLGRMEKEQAALRSAAA